MRLYAPILVSILFATVSQPCAGVEALSSPLTFHLTSGGNENYFLRDNTTSVQVLLTSKNNTNIQNRLVVALPAGNSGVLAYFLPLQSPCSINTTTLSITLNNGTLHSTSDKFNSTGIQVDLSFNANATLGVTILGAVRAMRDYVEGNGTMHDIFNYTLASYNTTFVRLHRRWINSTADDPSLYRGADFILSTPTGSSAQFSVTPGNNGTFSPANVSILLPPGASDATVQVKVVTNETNLTGFDADRLFLTNATNGTAGLQTALTRLSNGTDNLASQVSFLTYADKFTAGGWRFLTYFGRDSLIALRLLMPTLTPDAIEAALGAVIERANSTGALCHEETIGDYASFINIQNNRSDLGNAPFYDYKMIDTDLFLLPAMSHYFLELPQGRDRAAQFLARNATLQQGSYAEILNRTVTYNLARAIPFSQNSTVANLIGLRPGQPVGNWRDSNEGIGYGFYPFDVNTALVPASLRATQALLAGNIIPDIGMNSSDVGVVASIWEERALALFDVAVNDTIAEQRLSDFVQAANLSSALLGRAGNETGNLSTESNVTFYALSLKQDGTPVEVLNSDLGFNLVYGTNVSKDYLQHVIDALQPYPRGLLTNIGMVVSNPAYDSNRTNIEVLNRAAYHGTVVWSFQQGLMASGLARQLGFCAVDNATTVDYNPPPSVKPAWCADAVFVQSLRDAQTRLWTSINGGGNDIYSEVWSYNYDNSTNMFTAADLASLSGGVESDAIQLWSYGFLGLLDPSGNNTIIT